MNVLSAIGNISKDCELRYTPNGDAVAQFNFALNSGYGDKKITTWLNCSLWGKRAKSLAPMLLKGARVGITGELTNRPYTAKDGTERFNLEVRINDVTLLGGNSKSENNQSTPEFNQNLEDIDSSIPF